MRIIGKKTLLISALLLTTLQAKEGDVYAGLEWYGLSAKYDVTDKITAQAIGGFWGYSDLTSFTGRGLYKFKEQNNYTLYGYGSLSSWSYSGYGYNETVIGFGGGAGAEYDMRGIDPEFIPIFISADIGIEVANFDHYGSFSSLGIGLGIHYKF
jgi:hypothetical protein